MNEEPDFPGRFPHCDARVLHPRGSCQYCDDHPEWQKLREAWGVAFTGQEPTIKPGFKMLPCPADFNRPPDTDHDHRRWAGNVATTEDPVNETAASEMLYGHMARPGKRRRQVAAALAELGRMLSQLGRKD